MCIRDRRRSAHALADLVRQAPDPDAAVPGLSWTVSDVAAHALTVVRRSLGDLRRSASPLDTAAPVSYTHLDVYKRQVVMSHVLTLLRFGVILVAPNRSSEVE